MFALIHPFISLCLLRLRPQDLPASSPLLALAALAYTASTAIAHSALLSPLDAVIGGVVDALLLCGLTLSLLGVHRRWTRAVQTLTALVGAGTVTTLVAIPFLSWRVGVMRAGDPAGIELAFIAMIVVWNLAVIAHILRHALSTSFPGAVVIAIVMYLVSSQVLSAMLEGRMAI